jgi:hypothetical protein
MVFPHIAFQISITRSAQPPKILAAIPCSSHEGKDN